METKIKAAVIGGSGFTGLELLKILNNHPLVEVSFTTSKTYEGVDISEAFPSYSDKSCTKKLKFTVIDKIPKKELAKIDVIFLCLPPLRSMEFVNDHLLDFKGKIIDIGSDFRINDPENFKTWYGTEHKLKNILPDFVYGLPEIYKEEIASSRLIANPGCYPTSIMLALASLNIFSMGYSLARPAKTTAIPPFAPASMVSPIADIASAAVSGITIYCFGILASWKTICP